MYKLNKKCRNYNIRYFQMEGKMEKPLMEELKKLLSLIENYKEEAKELSIQKEGFNTVKNI